MKVYGVLPANTLPDVPTGLEATEITGGYVSLSVTDDGNTANWTWYRDGVPLDTTTSPFYTDSDVEPSHSNYSYQVQATNASGSTELSSALLVTTAANTAPEWLLDPQNLIIGQQFSINLAELCTDIDNHQLTFSLISGSVSGLSLVGSIYSGTPTTAQAPTLTFRANDGYTTSDTSKVFTVADPDVTAPSIPANVEASAVGSTVTVTCDASTDASGISHYRWFRDGAFRNTTASTTYEEQGVPDGEYVYSVSAVDASANANESAQGTAAPVVVSVAPPKPDAPVNFIANGVATDQVDLSWQAGPAGPTPTRYELYRSQSPTGPWTANLLPTALPLSYSDTGRASGTTYYYQLWAFNDTVSSDNPATANATTQGATGNPTPNKIVQQGVTTLQTMLNGLAANDLIEIRAATPGTKWTALESLTLSNKNFTQATKPRIWVRDGDQLLVKGSGGTAPIFQVTNSSNVEWAGNSSGRLGLEFADPATWNPLTGGKAGPHSNTVRGFNSDRIDFIRAKIHGIGTQTKGNYARRDCGEWLFDDCEISFHGSVDATDLLDIFAYGTIVKNSTLKYGGHNTLSLHAPWCIVRNCEFDGNWAAVTSAYDGIGTRLYGLLQAGHDTWSPTKGGNQHVGITTDNEFEFGPGLVEQCIHKNMSPEPDGNNEPSHKIQGYRLIIRGNLYYDFSGACLWVGPAYGNNTTYGGDGKYPGPCQAHCYTYHNTSYETFGIINTNGNNWTNTIHTDDEMTGFRFKNNVHAQLHDMNIAGRSVFYWATSNVPLDGNANKWKGSITSGCIFQGDATKMNFTLDGVEKTIAGTGAGSSFGTWPLNTLNNHVQTTALSFANAAARTFAGLTIASGVGFQDAPELTVTTASGTNTTNLPVVDAWYFADLENPLTWNLAFRGEQNDYIAVGTTLGNAVLVQIATINSLTSITLKTPITYVSGAKVWFAGNPANGTPAIWDNRGAGQ